MASNDLDLYGAGDLAPYSPGGLQPLAPAPAPDWNSPTDLLPVEHTPSQGQVLLFGQPLPPGVTLEQVMQGYQQLGNLFNADMMRLRHNVTHSQQAVQWLLNAVKNPPAKQAPRHHYNLYEHTADPIFQAFANYAYDHNFSQKLITDACWWVTEAGKRLAAQNTNLHGTPPRTAPQTSDPTAQLTDAQYDQLIKHNERVKAQTINRLAAKYGDHGYQQVIALAQAHLDRLPVADRKHFDAWTGDFPWTHMLSTFEAIDGLYAMAVGANSIDKSGIAQEIAAYEAMLRIPGERGKYMKDPQMQARFRELLRLRDGGVI